MKISFAQMPQWAAQNKRLMAEIADQSALAVIDSIKPGPSKNRHGRREIGTVPVDTSELENSRVIEKKPYGYRVQWGTDHAFVNHFGGNGMKGTFWIYVAANRWPGIVKKTAERAKGIN